MIKKIYSVLCVGLIVLSGCDYNEKYFDGLDDLTKVTDVKSEEYTLTSADYTSIAGNGTNKATAEKEGVEKELAAVGTNKYFTAEVPVGMYAPAFLAGKYPTADDGSSVQLSYNYFEGLPEQLAGIEDAGSYTLTDADYESVWGDDTDYFTPSKPAAGNLARILNSAVTGAEEGDYLLVTYNYSDKEPGSSGEVNDVVNLPLFEDFNTGVRYDKIDISGWRNVIEEGSTAWTYNLSGTNLFAQCSAHNNGEVNASLITPRFKATTATMVTFKYIHSYYAGNSMTVWVGENPDSTNDSDWDEITSLFDLSETGYGSFFDPGTVSLAAYDGKTIAVRFKYIGSQTGGTTTTMQVDDVNIYNDIAGSPLSVFAAASYVGTVEERNAVYTYNGTSWVAASETVMLDPADYTEMGGSNPNFSSSFAPATYIPTYLALNYPYAQEEDAITVVYHYYANSETTVRADEYVLTDGKWIRNDGIEEKIVQFVRTDGEWIQDPNVTLTLMPVRNDPVSKPFYQAVVDYVRDNIDSDYIDGYGTAEYYFGFSANYNNVSFNHSYWRRESEKKDEYISMSDDDLRALQWSRLPDGFIPGLKAFYPNADVVPGMDVVYTIYFVLYGLENSNSISAPNYVIQYEVTGKAQFEYIEDSLKPIE